MYQNHQFIIITLLDLQIHQNYNNHQIHCIHQKHHNNKITKSAE